jgi:hypothetical protein
VEVVEGAVVEVFPAVVLAVVKLRALFTCAAALPCAEDGLGVVGGDLRIADDWRCYDFLVFI